MTVQGRRSELLLYTSILLSREPSRSSFSPLAGTERAGFGNFGGTRNGDGTTYGEFVLRRRWLSKIRATILTLSCPTVQQSSSHCFDRRELLHTSCPSLSLLKVLSYQTREGHRRCLDGTRYGVVKTTVSLLCNCTDFPPASNDSHSYYIGVKCAPQVSAPWHLSPVGQAPTKPRLTLLESSRNKGKYLQGCVVLLCAVQLCTSVLRLLGERALISR